MTEFLRKGAHIGVGCCAALFAFLPPLACVGLAGLALVHNVVLLPRYGRVLWRAPDHARGYSAGVIAYSIALLGLSLAFVRRPDLAAGAWGILAFGDGLASPVGRLVRGPALPWNRAKRWSGFAGAALGGGVACTALLRFVGERTGHSVGDGAALLAVAFGAALAAAFVESAPLALDDNVTVSFTAAVALAGAASFDGPTLREHLPILAARLTPFSIAAIGLAAVFYRARAVNRSGAFAGAGFAIVVGVFGGPALFAALFVFVAVGSIATRAGWSRKIALGIAQSRGGRRDGVQAFAKLAVPTALGVFSCASTHGEILRWGALAAFAAALADTAASELGPIAKGRTAVTLQLPGLRRVAPGTPGGVSWAGSLAALVGAALPIVACCLVAVLGLGPTPFQDAPATLGRALAVLGAALFAVFAESAAGGFLTPRGLIGRGSLNLGMTVIAALAGMAIVSTLNY